MNHNFQPQRSHLNRSSGLVLAAVLPQRGHFIVQIFVEGPSGVTVKKWNVDSSMAFSNRRLIDIRSGCYSVGMVCISDSTRLMEKLVQQNQTVGVSRAVLQIQNEHRDIRYFLQ